MSKRKPLPTYVWQATVDGVFYNRWFGLSRLQADKLAKLLRGKKFVLHRGTIEWDEVELDGD